MAVWSIYTKSWCYKSFHEASFDQTRFCDFDSKVDSISFGDQMKTFYYRTYPAKNSCNKQVYSAFHWRVQSLILRVGFFGGAVDFETCSLWDIMPGRFFQQTWKIWGGKWFPIWRDVLSFEVEAEKPPPSNEYTFTYKIFKIRTNKIVSSCHR